MKRGGCSGFLLFALVVSLTVGFLYVINHPAQEKTGSILPQPLPPLKSGEMPPTTQSWYERAGPSDTQILQNQGCIEAQTVPGGFVILDWGQVDASTGTYGKDDFGYYYISDGGIANLVEHYIQGLWDCRTPSTSFAVAIGMSNYNICWCPHPDASNEQDSGWYKAGQSWGNTVNTIQQYIVNHGMAGQIVADGAFDSEAGWGKASESIAVVDGYNNVTKQLFFDFGDDEGITADIPGSEVYANATQWTLQNLWYVAYGAPDDLPVPEAYWQGQIDEWEALSVWGCQHEHGPLRIIISWTQTNINYVPQQAWTQLSAAIASNQCTAPMLSSLLLSSNIDYSQ